jgi:hypothetical protein
MLFREFEITTYFLHVSGLVYLGRMLMMEIPLHKKNRIDDPPISPVSFYEQLKLSIQKRLLSKEDTELSRCGRNSTRRFK